MTEDTLKNVHSSADPLLPTTVTRNPDREYFTESRQFQGIPGMEITSGGRLWATWYSGGVNEGPENFVLLVTSADRGQTWTEPVAAVDPPCRVRAYDPVLWMDPDGRLWWFWCQCYSRKDDHTFDGVAGVWGVCAEDPESDSPDWSEPVRIANGIMMNKPVVLSSGDWAYPTAIWVNRQGGETPVELLGEQFSNMVVSKDHGKSYDLRGGADVPKRQCDEHHIVELTDGRLWMLVRTHYGIGQSFSEDGGVTWSAGEDSGLGGPCSRFFIRRLQSGKLLLVNHQPDAEGNNTRCNLAASLSDDDGQSWYGELMLDERLNVSYPDGVQDENGVIWIIYDFDRYGEGDILFARFTEDDIVAGKCVSEQAVLKCMINHSGGVGK